MLSLIIPTYNCTDYLDETIGSVISQPLEDVELILVDDGSSDGTAEKLAACRDALKNKARILLREHGGVSSARNAGIEAASGEWVAFMDCDDCLMDGFFGKSLPLLNQGTDLYIFSFERVELLPDTAGCGPAERITPMTVENRRYDTASAFADHYIRTRRLLVYSACNKCYRKALLDEYGIRFREDMAFGEDRMFNFDYLRVCGSILTSEIRMFRYMQRNADSASRKVFPDYYNTIKKLHEAKVDCFTSLSNHTTEQEKADFISGSWAAERERMEENLKNEKENP